MTEIVICGYARSAFTPAKKGQLAKTRPDDLAAEVVKGLIKKIILIQTILKIWYWVVHFLRLNKE